MYGHIISRTFKFKDKQISVDAWKNTQLISRFFGLLEENYKLLLELYSVAKNW